MDAIHPNGGRTIGKKKRHISLEERGFFVLFSLHATNVRFAEEAFNEGDLVSLEGTSTPCLYGINMQGHPEGMGTSIVPPLIRLVRGFCISNSLCLSRLLVNVKEKKGSFE